MVHQKHYDVLKELKSALYERESFEDDKIRIFPIVTQTIPIDIRDFEGDNPRWEDARWQHQFQSNGHTYKYVFEASSETRKGMVTTEVRIKFEYLKSRGGWWWGSDWDSAGEAVRKKVSSLHITYSINSVPFNHERDFAESTHGRDLVISYSVNGGWIPCYQNNFRVSGNFFAQVVHPLDNRPAYSRSGTLWGFNTVSPCFGSS